MNWLLRTARGTSRIDRAVLDRCPRSDWSKLHDAIPTGWRVVPYGHDELTVSRLIAPRIQSMLAHVSELTFCWFIDKMEDEHAGTFIQALNAEGPEGESSVAMLFQRALSDNLDASTLVVPQTVSSESLVGDMEEFVLTNPSHTKKRYAMLSGRMSVAYTPTLPLDQVTPDTLAAFLSRVRDAEPNQPLLISSPLLRTSGDSVAASVLIMRLLRHLADLADTSTGKAVPHAVVEEFNAAGVPVPTRVEMQEFLYCLYGPASDIHYKHKSLADIRADFAASLLAALASALTPHLVNLLSIFGDGVQARFRELALSSKTESDSQRRCLAALFRSPHRAGCYVQAFPTLLEAIKERDNKSSEWCVEYMEKACRLIEAMGLDDDEPVDVSDVELSERVSEFFAMFNGTILTESSAVLRQLTNDALPVRARILSQALKGRSDLLHWAFGDASCVDLFHHCMRLSTAPEDHVRALIAPPAVWNGPDSVDSMEESMRLYL